MPPRGGLLCPEREARSLLAIETNYGISIFFVPSDDMKCSQAQIERAGERAVPQRKTVCRSRSTPSSRSRGRGPEAEAEAEEEGEEGRRGAARSEKAAKKARFATRRRRRRGRRGGRRGGRDQPGQCNSAARFRTETAESPNRQRDETDDARREEVADAPRRTPARNAEEAWRTGGSERGRRPARQMGPRTAQSQCRNGAAKVRAMAKPMPGRSPLKHASAPEPKRQTEARTRHPGNAQPVSRQNGSRRRQR